jgi:hypothetical protein
LEHREERLLADAEGRPEGVGRDGGRGAPDERERPLAERIGRRGVVADKAGRQPGLGVLDVEPEAQRRRARRGPVLDAELERGVGADATQVEIGVAAMSRSG